MTFNIFLNLSKPQLPCLQNVYFLLRAGDSVNTSNMVVTHLASEKCQTLAKILINYYYYTVYDSCRHFPPFPFLEMSGYPLSLSTRLSLFWSVFTQCCHFSYLSLLFSSFCFLSMGESTAMIYLFLRLFPVPQNMLYQHALLVDRCGDSRIFLLSPQMRYPFITQSRTSLCTQLNLSHQLSISLPWLFLDIILNFDKAQFRDHDIYLL